MAAHAVGPPAAAKSRTAALSIASNSVLIVLKVAAGTLTGSVAMLTEALHSATDLVASIVAFFSVRKADEPADSSHHYGHAKVEDMAAAIEGVLILIGCALILFSAVRSLLAGPHVHSLGIGIAVLGISIVVNIVVSARLYRRAAETGSPALAADGAHLRTDAVTSATVLVALGVIAVTDWEWLDPVIAIVVAVAIVVAGVRIVVRSSRVLVDEALPQDELDAVRAAVVDLAQRGVVGFHALRARQAGGRRYVDLHVQFRHGTSLEDAHATAHALQHEIQSRLRNADVLIHLEPEDRVRPGERIAPVA